MKDRVVLGASDWLALAAAPAFAMMALLMTMNGAGHSPPFCSPSSESFTLAGMAPMYLLMAIFHLPAWLRLVAAARNPG